MYAPYPENMMESIKKVEATRAERMATEPRRLSADEKDALLKKFHPDYNPDAFAEIKVGPNKGQKAPLELTKMLHSESRLLNEKIDLTKIDYDVDVLIIGGGGAGSSCAIEAHNAGANVMIVTKLRIGDANTMMAEGGIQAADKENDSPVQHYLDCFGGGHFAAKPELVKRLVMEAPDAIKWLNELGVEFDKQADGTMVTTHGGGTSRKRMHAAKDYSGAEIMRTLRDEVINRGIPVVEFTSAVELIKDDKGQVAGAVLLNMETGDYSVARAKTVVIATGGYGNTYFLSTNAMACNVTAAMSCYRKGAMFANPAYVQIHPTCIPVHGDKQSKLTLMSESLRNDGRIWVPKKKEDAVKLQKGEIKGSDIPEEDRDYYLERRYPAFGNLVPRDVASRAAKERCDAGFGVNNTGLAVFLDFSEAINRLGIDVVLQRYGNLFDMYEEITDVNPGELAKEISGVKYYNPMMIYPAIHYTMGGIWVDYELMTSIKGLFAIGECNFSDHGANRLGASALMQGLADGYFVLPYTIQNYLADQITVPRFSTDLPEFAEAEKAVQAKIDKFMSIQGKESVDSIHKKLGHIMWEYVGMGRTAEGLKKGITELKEIRKEFETNLFIPGSKEGMNVELDKAIRLYDFITMGELVAYDALNRNESCGGHFREEYQTEEGEAKRDDENFFYVACWEYQGDDEKAPILIKEPLVYEAIKVQTRNYKS